MSLPDGVRLLLLGLFLLGRPTQRPDWHLYKRNSFVSIDVHHVQHVHVHILTCPAEQSWLARQSAQREPLLQRFRPPRKSERKLCSIQNIQETEKYSWLRSFNVGNIISFNCNVWALKPVKTHFLSRKLCLAPRHTSPAQCTVCAWKQWSSVSQTYELW